MDSDKKTFQHFILGFVTLCVLGLSMHVIIFSGADDSKKYRETAWNPVPLKEGEKEQPLIVGQVQAVNQHRIHVYDQENKRHAIYLPGHLSAPELHAQVEVQCLSARPLIATRIKLLGSSQ